MKTAELIALLKPLATAEYEKDKQDREKRPTKKRLTWLACRFCAWMEARMAFDDMNTREMTNLFQEGFKGYKTLRDVAEYLGTYDEDDPEQDEMLARQLREFFGVP